MRMTRIFRVARRVLAWLSIAVAAALLTWAFLSRNNLDLQPWHREAPAREWRAADIGPQTTLAAYMKRQDELFQELARRAEAELEDGQRVMTNRYFAGSPMNPAN